MVIYRYARDPDRINTVRSTYVLKSTLLNIDRNSILDNICSFVRKNSARNNVMRVIYSRADVGKIAEYHENLNSVIQRFEDLSNGPPVKANHTRAGEWISCMNPSRISNSSTPMNDTEGSSKFSLTSGILETPTHIPAIATNWPSFFKGERPENVENVGQSDIVIVCVFPKHFRLSVLTCITLVLLDQLE